MIFLEEIYDTPGQEDYDKIRPFSYADTNVFLLCFSLSCRHSFQNIKSRWIPEIRYFNPKTPIVLVGTKQDLRDELLNTKRWSKNQIPIKYTEGLKLMDEVKAVDYVECSSKNFKGLTEVFMAVVRSAKFRKNNKTKNCRIL